MIGPIATRSLSTFVGSLLFAVSLGAYVQAEEKTYIEIRNCEKSKHEIRVETTACEDCTGINDSAKIHSGEDKTVFCNSDECLLVFINSSNVLRKHTSHSPWYVHVKSSHKFTVSNEASLCY